MSDKLKIYACSGIGTEPGTEKVPFVDEGTSAIANTQAMNACLAQMNLLSAELRNIPMSDAERAEKLDELDIYSICFYYARLYKGKTEQLTTACQAIAQFDKSGGFDSKNADATWHEERVNEIIEAIDSIISDGAKSVDSELYKWLQENIIARDAVGVSGIGATVTKDYGDLNKYLYNGGTYFLYLFTPSDAKSHMTDIMKKRARKQAELYNYCKKCFCPEYGGIYGSEADMQAIIRTGIIEDFGHTPEDVMRTRMGLTTYGVGPIIWTAAAIATIIAAALSFILGCITLILQYAASVQVAKYTVPDDIEYGYSQEDDYPTDGIITTKNWWWVAAAGLAGLLLFKKTKN